MIFKEGNTWLVINKPSGFHSVADQENLNEPSVEEWLKINRPELQSLPECGLVHRLDQKTSGVLLVAKTPEIYLSFRELMRGRDIQKTYLAIVVGSIKNGEFKLYFSSRYKRSQKITVSTSGSPSTQGQCRWRTLASDKKHSLLEVELIGRGKRHQIRAGLAYQGHPLVGDTLYGGPKSEFFGLHSWKLSWQSIKIECPPPSQWPESLTRKIKN